MSRGRRSASLSLLQEAVLLDERLGRQVKAALLGASPEEVHAPTPERLALGGDWPHLFGAPTTSDDYGKPADYAHRTTAGDVRREARDLTLEALGHLDRDAVLDYLAGDSAEDAGLTLAEAGTVERVMARAVDHVRSTLPADRVRKGRYTARMPDRRGECSAVVTRRRDGSVHVGGEPVEDAAAALRNFDPYRRMTWREAQDH